MRDLKKWFVNWCFQFIVKHLSKSNPTVSAQYLLESAGVKSEAINWAFRLVVGSANSPHNTKAPTPGDVLFGLCSHRDVLNFAFAYFADTLRDGRQCTILKPEMLIAAGWIEGSGVNTGNRYFRYPDIKERDAVIIEFENHYYRVWYGPRGGVFLTLQDSAEWLEMFLLLQDKHHEFANPGELLRLFPIAVENIANNTDGLK